MKGLFTLVLITIIGSLSAQPIFSSHSMQPIFDEGLDLFSYDSAIKVDIDNDGDIDIIAISVVFNYTISCYYNNGDGVFDEKEIIYTDDSGEWPIIRINDIDNDGKIDILLIFKNGVYQLKNNEDGTYTKDLILLTGFDYLSFQRYFSGDLNGDQIADILILEGNQVTSYLNNGNAIFLNSIQSAIDTLHYGLSFSLFDINNDGSLDLSLTDNDRHSIWYSNDGLGEFTFEDTINFAPNYIINESLIQYDFNNDNIKDFVFEGLGKKIYWKKSNGDGTFEEAELIATSAYEINKFFFFDVNSDGNNDLVIEHEISTYITIHYWIENDEGVFTNEKPFEIAKNAVYSESADFNQDGLKDILLLDHTRSLLSWTENLGNAKFSNPIYIEGVTTNDRHLEIIDIDNDQNVDFLSSLNSSADMILVHENDDINLLGYPTLLGNDLRLVNTLESMDIVDVNRDGYDDILVFGSYNRVYWFENNKMGGFIQHELSVPLPDINTTILAVSSGDINGDNQTDIIINIVNSELFYLKNDGSNNFLEKVLIHEDLNLFVYFKAADFDMDGDTDIVLAKEYFPGIYYLESKGDGSFEDVVKIENFSTVTNLDIVDIDNDGDLDILPSYSSNTSQRSIYLENNGSALFSEKHATDGFLEGIVMDAQAVDLDDDQDLDIVFYTESYKKIKYYTQLTDSSFSNATTLINLTDEIENFRMIDIDMDGDLDILATLSISETNKNRIVWYENRASVFTSTPQSITNLFEEIKVYPNPTSTILNFELEKQLPFNFDLCFNDVSGKKIKSYKNLSGSKITLDIAEIPSGVYFVTMYYPKENIFIGSQKVVIN